MMDLFDAAKPIRDAAIIQFNEAKPCDCDDCRAETVLQVHLTAVFNTWLAHRFGTTETELSGEQSRDLERIIARGFGIAIANVASVVRPDGMSDQQSVMAWAQRMFRQALHAANSLQHGDVSVVDVTMDADGVMRTKPFDFREIMKGAGS